MKIAVLYLENPPASLLTDSVLRAGIEPVPVLGSDALSSLSAFAGYLLTDSVQSVDPAVIASLKDEVKRGKPLLALGSAASVLLDSGLIPGLENDKPAVLLSEETSIETIIQLTDAYQYNAFTRRLMPETVFSIRTDHPVRHFILPPALLMEIQIQGLNIFSYGNTTAHSDQRIAALSNKAGNVMALLPELVSPDDWDKIFHSMRETIQENHFIEVPPLYYYPRNTTG